MAIAVAASNNGIYSTDANVPVSFGETPVEGDLMVVSLWTRATTITTPSGWTRTVGVGTGDDHAMFHKVAGASESTSQVFVVSSVDQNAWVYYRLSGVDTTTPIRATASEDTTGSTTSRSSGTTDTSPQSSDFAIGSFGAREEITAQSFTNSFTFDSANNPATPTTVAELSLGTKTLSASGAVETTMSWTNLSSVRGLMAVYALAGGGNPQTSGTINAGGGITASVTKRLNQIVRPTSTVSAGTWDTGPTNGQSLHGYASDNSDVTYIYDPVV